MSDYQRYQLMIQTISIPLFLAVVYWAFGWHGVLVTVLAYLGAVLVSTVLLLAVLLPWRIVRALREPA